MRPAARRRAVPIIVVGALNALTCLPGVSAAQDLTSIALSAKAAVARAVIGAPRGDQAGAPAPASSEDGHVSFVMQSFYVSTVAVQWLDAQSTFKALDAGAVESNSLVKPFASNRPAFIALKAAMSGAFIYAGHDLSKRHRIGAIVALSLVNSLYTTIALHNYHVAAVMAMRR
jgi:uncharacterized protein DUF5658